MVSIAPSLFYQASQQEEIDALQKESEMPIEDLLKNLPKEILEKPAKLDESLVEGESSDSGEEESKDKKEKKVMSPPCFLLAIRFSILKF